MTLFSSLHGVFLVSAAAEGAHLCIFAYNDLKNEKNQKFIPEVDIYTEFSDDPDRYINVFAVALNN